VAVEEMIRIQRDAHILFLPLAFNSPYPGLVRTSATTKMGEYMAARRPVLVLAPPDSFVSWYFRTNDCGFVIDSCDPVLIAETIEQVLDGGDLVQQVTTRAWEQAHRDFDIRKAREQFWNLIARDRAAKQLAGVSAN
jgi:glycosyltransferase involved in cell wall biosynthesis